MAEILRIRPVATFRGISAVPLLALSYNSLYPDLRLTEEGIEIRLMAWRKLSYGQIERVEYSKRLAHQLRFVERDRPWAFACNFFDLAAVLQIFEHLQAQGVVLSPKAVALLGQRE